MAALSNGLSQGGTTAELGPVESWTDRELVEELCDIESGLNLWEVDFVEDMARRVVSYGERLSPPARGTRSFSIASGARRPRSRWRSCSTKSERDAPVESEIGHRGQFVSLAHSGS